MYQVTIYLFASGTVTNYQFAHRGDAEAQLEKTVAGYRSAGVGQAKTFFTASLLNTKTGKYLGFVTEAPPAVELEGASE